MMILVLGVFGALFGSFACAQVWRLRARQLVDDLRDGEKIDRKEMIRLKGLIRPVSQDRSECLSCHHQLAWYDLIPIVSWVRLRGRCRYCHAKIGATEVLCEIGLALTFLVSFMVWPYALETPMQIALFVVWLIACVVMTILFVYDAKWSLLPFRLNVLLIGIAMVFYGLLFANGYATSLWSLTGALVLLGGLYLLFSLFGWSGMGDGILGVALALFVGRWGVAFLVLFMANLLGCIMLVPLQAKKRLHRNVKIPFGPFLILATVIGVLWGGQLILHIFGPTSAFILALMV